MYKKIYCEDVNIANKILMGKKIITIKYFDCFEGGQTIVFSDGRNTGIYIMGFTEIGNWIEHLEWKGMVLVNEYYIDEINRVRESLGFSPILSASAS